MKKIKGFTLIELIVVMAIIATLASIITPLLFTYADKARISKANTNARHVYGAAVYAMADCFVDNTKGVFKPGTVYMGDVSDLIARDASGGQINMENYFSTDFTGYFAFVTNTDGSGCVFALWSNSPIAASDVKQLSSRDVEATARKGLVGCYPLKEDP